MSRREDGLEFVKTYLKKFGSRNSQTEEEIKETLKNIKNEYILEKDQHSSKNIWCLEQILEIQNLYFLAFDELKQNKFYEGWCTLEKGEVAILHLEKHFDFTSATDDYKLQFIKRKINQIQELFPYEFFMSPEFKIEEQKCSICHAVISVRNSCGHQIGEIYDGESCARAITKANLIALALVKTPRNKYAVPFATNKKTGKAVDHYNYSFVRFLMTALSSPFSDWSYHWTKKRHPHSKFKDVGRNDSCPCESGEKYKKCCLNESGVLRDHLEFDFSFPISSDLPEIIYTY